MTVPAPPRDEPSFAEFYRSHRAKMIGYVRVQATGRVHDPELVAEEGWVKFFPHWENCEYPGAYLRQCMISAANDALNRTRAEPPTYSSDDKPEMVSAAVAAGRGPIEAGPDDKPYDPELTAALQRLSPKLREFVLLDTELNLGERSVSEIAGILGIKRSAAYARKNRAYAALRKLLPPDYLELRATRPGRGGVGGWSTS
jgi:DNA-directed RNA polymerase specialized sigma24 family protein